MTNHKRKLYRVEATVTAYVWAEDERSARSVMRDEALRGEEHNAEYRISVADKWENIEPAWRDALAYTDLGLGAEDVDVETAVIATAANRSDP